MTVLLKTRMHIPAARSEQVTRTHLFERLDAGFRKQLTLISAPPGFGKTTLVSTWIKKRRIPTAWFSVDKIDNHPESFWSYVICALQGISSRVGKDSLAVLHKAPSPPTDEILASLLNELNEIKPHFCLVLDDYHNIETREIQEDLFFLIEHMPPAGHLILLTRVDPPWSLSRLRLLNKLEEIRIEDLRFTIEETTEFLNSIMSLSLSSEDIQVLETRTEGWIAGLQMSALSMQGRVDKSKFIESFSGSHHFVLDYLVEEVLERQPASIQEFLIKTSILSSLNAELCAELTGLEDCQDILKTIEKANLFLIPLDDERRWYRYHHLFTDLLQTLLRQKWPGQEAELHRRASRWYVENGLVAEAINHASATGDIVYVAQLIEKNALTIITVYNYQLATLADWLDTLPEKWLYSRPWLAMAHGWLLSYSGNFEAAEAVLHRLDQVISRMPPEPDGKNLSQEHLLGCSAAIHGYQSVMLGEIKAGLEWLQKALLHLPYDDIPGRVFTTVVTGAALGTSGDLEGGIKLLSKAADRWREAKNPLLPIMILCELAGLQIMCGQLSQGINSCEEALRFSNEYARRMGVLPPNIGFAYARLSYILRERNELQSAIYYAQKAEQISTQWGQKDSMSISYVYLAMALQAAGDTIQAQNNLNKARQISKQISTTRVEKVSAFEAKIRFLQGDRAFLKQWSEKNAAIIDEELSLRYTREYITYARSILIQDRLYDAQALLARLLHLVHTTQAVPFEIEVLILKALVLKAMNEVDQALETFEYALRLAEPEHYVRIFIDEGDRIKDLLHLAVRKDGQDAYAKELLNLLEFSSLSTDETSSFLSLLPGAPGDTLTPREVEILCVLATNKSIMQIADELCIAVSTLRTHIRSIYGKLGIHSRIEAVAIAREFKLL